MTTDWRTVLAAAGGVENAMLYGASLRVLVNAIEAAEAERDEWQQKATVRDYDRVVWQQDKARAEEALALERAAVVELSNVVDPMRKKLNAALVVIEAARDQRKRSVVLTGLSKALDEFDR